jgi:hypothetical protein
VLQTVFPRVNALRYTVNSKQRKYNYGSKR